MTVQGADAANGIWARPGGSVTLTGQSVININAPQNPTFYNLVTANLVTPNGPVGSIFGVTSGTPISGLLSSAGSITSVNTIINVTSATGVGAFAGSNSAVLSTIDLTNNTITTTGANSFGIEAISNSQIVGRNSQVTTSGGAPALFISTFNGLGTIDLTDTTVRATGANTVAVGLSSLNLSPNITNVLRLSAAA